MYEDVRACFTTGKRHSIELGKLMGILKYRNQLEGQKNIKEFVHRTKVKFRVNGEETKNTLMGRGVRQGRCESQTVNV